MQRLKLVLRALKSIAPHTAARLPITNDILLKIRPHMKLHTYEGKMLWAAFTFGHACLMRGGEFTTSSYKDKKYLSLGAWKWEQMQNMARLLCLLVRHQRRQLTSTYLLMAVIHVLH